jgi:nucleotide-binding universal stress UspA family protein
MIAARPIGLAPTIATVSPGCTPPFSTPTSNDVGRMSARNKTYLRHANETAATAAACASAAGFVAEVEVLEARRNESSSPPRLRDVDLIVVGSRGLGPIAGALLGSVSREIVDHADRPVLVAARRSARRRAA